MADPLHRYRCLVHCPADAIRWACVLEATAPKAGNVHPGRPFDDLTYRDFVTAAEITAGCLTDDSQPIAGRMLRAVQQTRGAAGTNVNLGIVLLLGPLVAAERWCGQMPWQSAIQRALEEFTPADGQIIFQAIAAAAPGGLGTAPANDVRSTRHPVDIVAAMSQAADHDRIARQYATGFADLRENLMPLVENSIREAGDLLLGIARAHLAVLASAPDSLIVRKHGWAVGEQVCHRARSLDPDDPLAVDQFDRWLRGGSPRLNPGTTADLIAASLYLLLRGDSPYFEP